MMKNRMEVTFPAISVNESLARLVVSAFLLELDPDMDTLSDIKTAVSEAVTNAVIHGYDGEEGDIYLKLKNDDRKVYIEIEDRGRGIEDVKKAMEPMFTTKPAEERSGLGFTVMESFCDKVRVYSRCGKGTTVTLFKKLGAR